MAIKLKFDLNNCVEEPTFILAHRNGQLIGKLPAVNIQCKDVFNGASEARFDIYKTDMPDSVSDETIKITGFELSSTIATNSGQVRIGEITDTKFQELFTYALNNEKVINPVIRIKKGNQETTYKELAVSAGISTSGNPIIGNITQESFVRVSLSSTNTEFIYMNDAGYVYIKDPSSYGLVQDDYIYISFVFNVPTAAIQNPLWEQVKDLKLVWAREWNNVFEIKVDIDDTNGIKKSISATSLGESELSQINIYDFEVNTEDDILRDDYVPTVLYDESNPDASLLDKVLDKAPHYTITHVDSTIANIQRVFTFDSKSILDAFKQIETEINCLIEIKCYYDNDGVLHREVSAYDLESNCLECGNRGEFTDVCDKCGSENVIHGHGEDTTIFISRENLADSITYTTDIGSVKNCFRLEGGDDLMTATIANCNPNGSSYIWYISDDVREDMSSTLKNKLRRYDESYSFYQSEYVYEPNEELTEEYNELVEKYIDYNSDLETIPESTNGYSGLMEIYYNTIDMNLFLNNSLMPTLGTSNTNAGFEAAKLSYANLSPVAVSNINTCTLSTANNAVLAMAKTLVDPNYQVKIIESTYVDNVWIGNFIVTNYSDDTDTYTVTNIYVNITDDYERFVTQQLEKTLTKKNEDANDIVTIFKLENDAFANKLKEYSLSMLNLFHNSCQSCLDILINQGVSDSDSWANQSPDLYRNIYYPYYLKLGLIENEIIVRESEISTVQSMQESIISKRNEIQTILDLRNYLGETLWLEFISYRREDVYENSNYISDGLNNAELFDNALQFLNTAQKDIYKSANLQHSISATLKNLLVMKEFEPIVDYFEVGNWLRIEVDNKIYQLRLIEYTIDFTKIDSLSIVFSDVKMAQNGITDVISVLNSAKSMATSYSSVSRQAMQGAKTKTEIQGWAKNGLALTNMKIIDDADNQNVTWDEHGILCREYLPISETYDDRQVKIINKGLYVTDDGWLTSKAGVGAFTYYNPESKDYENGYGVIADLLVGNLILSENVGVYNENNSITLDRNGLTIVTSGGSGVDAATAFTIARKDIDENQNETITNILYVDSDGQLVLNGSIKVNTAASQEVSTLDDMLSTERITNEIQTNIYDVLHGENGVYNSISAAVDEAMDYTESMLNEYKSDIGRYMDFSDDGLILGSTSSTFKTIIDNQRMAFVDGDRVAAYISNEQLFIGSAVIQNRLAIANFYFVPREDGGVSIIYLN